MLDLSDNWLNPAGGAAIADMLEENCYITELVRLFSILVKMELLKLKQ